MPTARELADRLIAHEEGQCLSYADLVDHYLKLRASLPKGKRDTAFVYRGYVFQPLFVGTYRVRKLPPTLEALERSDD